MHLNISMVLALLLPFFADPGLTDDGCYKQGDTWDSIATGDSLDTALNELCDRMIGTFDVGIIVSLNSQEFQNTSCYKQMADQIQVRKCHNVGSNRINAEINIKKGPGNSINVKVTKETCFSLLSQVSRLATEQAYIDPNEER